MGQPIMNAVAYQPDRTSERPPDLEPIRLDFRDEGRRVVVSPEDQDRFVTSSRSAAEACKQAYNYDLFNQQFRKMLSDVRQWAESSLAGLHACYIGVRDGHLMIYVVPKGQRYDRALSNELTDLDISIAEKYQLIRCEVMQIPSDRPERLAAFLNPEEAIEVYGQHDRASDEVDAQP